MANGSEAVVDLGAQSAAQRQKQRPILEFVMLALGALGTLAWMGFLCWAVVQAAGSW